MPSLPSPEISLPQVRVLGLECWGYVFTLSSDFSKIYVPPWKKGEREALRFLKIQR